MLKSEIIAALSAKYTQVVPPQGNPYLAEDLGSVKKYLFYFLDTGVSPQADPIAHKSHLVFYVYDEGGAGEAAYYEDQSPRSPANQSLVASNPSTPTALEIARVYNSPYIRDRVCGCMIKAAFDIYNEAGGTANHSERMRWATDILRDVYRNASVMMAFVSVNAVILGGAWTDSDIQFIVNSNIDKWALTEYV